MTMTDTDGNIRQMNEVLEFSVQSKTNRIQELEERLEQIRKETATDKTV